MSTQIYHNNKRVTQWRMLLVYNIYRFISILVLFSLYFVNTNRQQPHVLYTLCLFGYGLVGVGFLVVWYRREPRFEQQVLLSGTIDLIAMVLLIHMLGYLESGLGILLNVSIAVLSILSPGRLAIYFAAIATCMLLGISSKEYLDGNHELAGFFSIGIYGTSFFATALTAWYLARMVHTSEVIAKRRAKELFSMQRLNEYIVARLQYGVIYVDSDMHVKMINAAARQLLQIPHRKKNSFLKELSPSLYAKYLDFLKKRRQTEQVGKSTLEDALLQVHFIPASFTKQTAMLILLHDMTFIAQQAQQLKLASLGRFSASIAHELRNPLGVIAHAAQLMGDQQYFNAEDLRLKQLIINHCHRMNQVIKNVLQISRRQQSKVEVIELTHFLTQFKQAFCLLGQCHIVLSFPAQDRIEILFDKSQLEQILTALCDNSLQHGRDSAGHVHIRITVVKNKDRVALRIQDNGTGVPAAICDKIFDPFFSTLETGNGMGLFIAKELCEMNQARMALVPTQSGACFVISLNDRDEMLL